MDINKGLNGFQLKILALVFMTLDHIYYFFNGILPIPYIFTIIGRLAMPIFVFLSTRRRDSGIQKTGKNIYLGYICFQSVWDC